MTLALMVVTHGRSECLMRTAASLVERWEGPAIDSVVVVDDSGDPDYREWLLSDAVSGLLHGLPGQPVAQVVSHKSRKGFAAAINTGWVAVRDHDWIFHLEDDFVFEAPVLVDEMISVLLSNDHLVQMSLLRQACNDQERDAGGLVQAHPGEFVEHTDGRRWWMEQRLYFTTNPSVYRGSLTRIGWPWGQSSEGVFTHTLKDFGFFVGAKLVKPDEVRFGVWGRTTDPPRISHIGERTGSGY